MQLHPHNHPFCFFAIIIHFFVMCKVYTLIAKLLCMKRDKQNNG